MPIPVALQPAYIYRARLAKLTDGDTCVLDIDLGFFVAVTEKVRFLGLNAPELHAPDPQPGRDAAAYVATWFAQATGDWPLRVVTVKDQTEKYGRFKGTIYRSSDGACLNVDLVTSGHAQAWDGKGAKP